VDINHLSYSQVSMYIRCPRQWAYRYAEGIINPPAGALVKGSAVHKGVEGNYIQKVETAKDLPRNDVVEIAVTNFEERQIVVDWSREEETPAKAKDAVASMTGIYQEEVAPMVQPLLVEQKFDLNIGGELVTGIMDVVTANGVRDTKTASKTPPSDTADNSLQLACYSMAYQDIFGELPHELCLDYTVNLKTPKALTQRTSPNQRLMEIFGQTVEQVGRAIRAEIFYPNTQGWHCSQKMCGYWHLCRA
jgi:hypothetical protein